MKKLLRNSFLLAIICMAYSCAPKYTAHFNYKPHENDKKQLVVEDVQAMVEEIESKEIIPPVSQDQVVASSSDQPMVAENPIEKLVAKHNVRVEEINDSGLEGKELKRALKKETKRAKKEIINEVKDMQKKGGDDEYIIMMILAIIIPPLGVGLTYGITNEFWISLILTLIFWLPGAIYSVIKVNEHFKG